MLSSKKHLAEQILEPLIKPLSSINPNILTLIGIIPSILFFVFVILHWYIFALIAFCFNILDIIDGMVARKYDKVTKFGGLLDSTIDRISDFLTISAFAFANIVRWEIIAPLLLFSFLTSYIRARGELANPNISLTIGLIQRTERHIMIIIALIIYLIFPYVTVAIFNLSEIVFIILLILSSYTIFQRLTYLYRKF